MDGVLEQLGDQTVLRYRRELSHPREKVWRGADRADTSGRVVPDLH